MPLIEWNQNLSVGVPEMDRQHRRLVDMINQLHDAMSKGQGREAIQPVLSGLLQYTRTHFAAEERLMKQANFPRLEDHVKQHADFTSRLYELEQRHRAEDRFLTIDVMNFLHKWLVNHIQNRDKEYGPFVMAATAK